MTFNVHYLTSVRVKVSNVRAASPSEAMALVRDGLDFHQLLRQCQPTKSLTQHEGLIAESVDYDEGGPLGACVDPLHADGTVNYEDTTWLDADGHDTAKPESLTGLAIGGNTALATFVGKFGNTLEVGRHAFVVKGVSKIGNKGVATLHFAGRDHQAMTIPSRKRPDAECWAVACGSALVCCFYIDGAKTPLLTL